MKIKNCFLLFILLSLLNSCMQVDADLSYIKKNTWEYNKGFRAGDTNVICLSGHNDKWKLHHDTVFFDSKPVAVITRYERLKESIEIRSVKTGKRGEYHNAALH